MNVKDKLTTIAENVPRVYEAGYEEGESMAHKKPYLDTSKIANFYQFCAQTKLTDEQLELLDTSGATSTYSMFTGCTYTSIPQLDTSKVITFDNMFYQCSKLTSVPALDTSSGTSFTSMFSNCSVLTTIPDMNTSKGTKMGSMFSYCSALKTAPNIDTSLNTAFGSMFDNCKKLTSISQLNTSLGTGFSYMFRKCALLTQIPEIDTSNGTGFSAMFDGCTALKTIPKLNITKATSSSAFSNMFRNCSSLENITFEGTINSNISFAQSTKLTHDSLMSIINALGATTSTKTLTLGSTNLAKLTSTEKAVATGKGWTLA